MQLLWNNIFFLPFHTKYSILFLRNNGNSFIMAFKVLENMEEKTIEETITNTKKQINVMKI